MSIVKVNAAQIGQSVTATNNFTLYQPSSPDGTVRLGNGNSGSVTDLVTVNSSGNVGIGTSSPKEKFDSRGAAVFSGDNATGTSAYGTAAGLLLSTSSDNTKARVTAVSNGANSISLVLRPLSSGSAVDAVTIDPSGNLGLGVTPSAWSGGASKALQINNFTIGQTVGFDVTAFSTNAYLAAASVWRYIGTASATQYQQYGGQHQFFTAPSGTAGNAISFTQAMTLDASGNLLVGTTVTPTSQTNSLSVANKIFCNVNAAGYQNVNSQSLQGTDGYGIFNHINGSASGSLYIAFGYNGGGIGSITQNGTTGVLYNIVSDRRFKIDKGIATDTSVIDNTVVHDFEWKVDGSIDRGVFAQEAHKVKPSAVTEGTDELNEDGTPVHPWGVDYSKYVPDLIVYCQQLRAELNELKAKVNA